MVPTDRTVDFVDPLAGDDASPLTAVDQFALAAAPVWPAYLVSAALCLTLEWEYMPRVALVAWAVVYLAFLVGRWLLFRRYWRMPPAERIENEAGWCRLFMGVMICYGCLQSLLIAPAIPVVPEGQAALLTFMIFFSCTLVSTLMPLSRQSLYLYLAITLIPVSLAWLLKGGDYAWFLPAALLLAAALFLKFGHGRLLDIRQRHDMALRLAQSVALLRQSNVSRTRMIMEASHDLRQPAHALSMMTERLRFATPGPDLQARITDMEQCINSLTDMLGELMEYSKLDLGEYTPRLEGVDVQSLLRELDQRFAAVAARKQLAWSVQAGTLQARAVADPWLLQRVLNNLVTNAIRYTVSGSVSVRAVQQDHEILIRVEDTGVGIADHEQEHVFIEYVRVPRNAQAEPGRGIGLAFVRRAVEAMGCRLELSSELGRGTRVVVGVGVAGVDGDVLVPQAGASLPASGLHGRRVVLIENDELLRRSMQEVLIGWGAAVVAVADAAHLDTLDAAPSLVLADLHLDGDANGLQAIEQLRQRYRAQWIPAILLTGDMGQDVFEQARQQGVEVAYKPLRPSRLRHMIVEALTSTQPAI